MITGKRRTPIGQDAHQAAVGNILPDMVFKEVGQSCAAARSGQRQSGSVERKRSVHSDPQLAPVFLEFPGMKAAECWQANVNAAVSGQILRGQRF
jgi:hypothetical protein